MKNYQEKKSDINIFHIDVLDGIRAFAVIIVVWFHFWQQCWIMPVMQTPSLAFLRIKSINLDWIPRTGYIMVTMMIFLSGFCLYLPYARHTISGEDLPSVKNFFRKRVARIIPSYLFCIIIVLLYNIFTGAYISSDYALNGDSSFILKDLLSHLTFTFNLSPQISSNTLLNGVLWTVALEVQFYIVFPIIQSCFRKKPIITYAVMNIISFAYIFYASGQTNTSFLLHQIPSYLGVYANGFVGAMVFVGIAKSIKRNKYIGLISTITSIGCIYVYYLMMNSLNTYSSEGLDVNLWQMNNRFYLSILFLVFIISTTFSLSWYRAIFSNRAARFLSMISFNLYIWHQVLCVYLKRNHIPFYEGDKAPNELGDQAWMWKYFILSIVVAIVAACLSTFFIEKPLSKWIMRIGIKENKNQKKPGSNNSVHKKNQHK